MQAEQTATVAAGFAPEREMTERDDDIEFDFFDDPEPTEIRPAPQARRSATPAPAQPQRGGSGPRGPRRPQFRTPSGGAPLARLIGLVALAILIIVLLVFWVNSCSGSGKKNSYRHYLEKVGAVGHDSQQIGRELNDLLVSQGVRFSELNQKLVGLSQQQQQDVARARAIAPPGPLRIEQDHVIDAMQLRVSGLNGLISELKRAQLSANDAANANRLAQQAQRLVASDVLWDDFFRGSTVTELQRQGVGDLSSTVPDSNFVQFPDFASTRAWTEFLSRLKQRAGSGDGRLHGTGLILTRALPSGKELSTDTDNIVVSSTKLGFEVVVKDTGDSQEVQVQVTLTIQQNPTPIVKRQTIPLINAGEEKTVTFTHIGQVAFSTRVMVKVDIKPVPGESNPDNNSAQYPVIFSLTP